MIRSKTLLPVEPVESLILRIREQRVILDKDPARLYGVQTKALNQAVKRNSSRFPSDFVFRLTPEEVRRCISRSQFVTLKQGQNIKYLPYAFTEHGAIMAAHVLNSERAHHMSVFVVRAFISMRASLSQNRVLAGKLAELEKKLTTRLDDHERAILQLLDEIRKLMETPLERPEPSHQQIGFGVRERRATYAANRK